MLRAGSRHAQGRLKPFDKLRTGCAELEGLGAGGFGFSLETAAVDLGVDLGTVDADLAGSLDPQANLIPVYGDDDNANIITNHNCLVRLAREDEHEHPEIPTGDSRALNGASALVLRPDPGTPSP
jgi:hypothetical protein